MQATQTITITIVGAPLLFTSGEPPVGRVGQLFSHQLQVAGGKPPYTFRLAGGLLPSGLSLNITRGTIDGVPERAGDYTFTVEAETKQLASRPAPEEKAVTMEDSAP